MKRLILTLSATIFLVLGAAMPVYAAEERSIDSTVEVAEIIAFTIVDNGKNGLNFGPVAPGTVENPELAQDEVTPAIQLVIGPETNVAEVDLAVRGETSDALSLESWFQGADAGGLLPIPLEPSYQHFTTVSEIPNTVSIWWFTNIPLGTPSDTYTCTVWYRAAPALPERVTSR